MIVGGLLLLAVELTLALAGVIAPLLAGLGLARIGEALWASVIWLGWPMAIVGGCVLFGLIHVLTLLYALGAACVLAAVVLYIVFGRPGLGLPVLDGPRWVLTGHRHGGAR